MNLEDLTHGELVKLIKGQVFSQPTHRDIIRVRWETITAEAQRTRERALEEIQKWTGDRTPAGYRNWCDAQELFTKGMKLDKKAEVVFKELCETKD